MWWSWYACLKSAKAQSASPGGHLDLATVTKLKRKRAQTRQSKQHFRNMLEFQWTHHHGVSWKCSQLGILNCEGWLFIKHFVLPQPWNLYSGFALVCLHGYPPLSAQRAAVCTEIEAPPFGRWWLGCSPTSGLHWWTWRKPVHHSAGSSAARQNSLSSGPKRHKPKTVSKH